MCTLTGMLGGVSNCQLKIFWWFFLLFMKVWLDFIVQGVELYVIFVADFIFNFKNTVWTLWPARNVHARVRACAHSYEDQPGTFFTSVFL